MRLKNNLIFLVLAVVTVVAFFFFRFYQIQHRVIFDFDQESFSREVFSIIREGNPTLLGPRVLSDKGFFLGPYFIYALTPFYLASALHPFGLVYFLVFYNIVFFAAASRIISRQWSKLHAAFFLLAWATNSLIVQYDTTPWNPISIPLGVLVTWYLLRKIYTEKKALYWALLGLNIGLFFNQHFQFIYLALFSGVFLLLAQKHTKLFSIKRVLAAAASFLATYIPLFIFDIRNNFLNIKLFLGFFTQDVAGTSARGRFLWIEAYETIFLPIIGYRDPILALTFFIVIAICMFYLIKRSVGLKQLFYKSAFVLWVILPFLFMLYNKSLTDYYLISLYPFIYITLIDALITAKRHILIAIGLVIVMYINYSLFLLVVRPNPLGMMEKDRAIRVMQENIKPNKPYNVTFNMPPGMGTGYTYLLEWYNIKPVTSPGTPLIEINNPKLDGDVNVNSDIGIKIPQEMRK